MYTTFNWNTKDWGIPCVGWDAGALGPSEGDRASRMRTTNSLDSVGSRAASCTILRRRCPRPSSGRQRVVTQVLADPQSSAMGCGSILIRHQQVRGSSPRVGSSICKRLRTDDTSSHTNVSPQCHQIAGAQPRPLLPCASPVTPAYAAPMWKRTQPPTPPAPVAQVERALAFSAEG